MGKKFRARKLQKCQKVVNTNQAEIEFKEKYLSFQKQKALKQRNSNLKSFGGQLIVGGRVVGSAAGGLGLRSQSLSRLKSSNSGHLSKNKIYEN